MTAPPKNTLIGGISFKNNHTHKGPHKVSINISKPTVATVGLLMLMETLCGPLWVWLFLNEIPPISVFLGGAVIISAIILKSFDKKHSKT